MQKSKIFILITMILFWKSLSVSLYQYMNVRIYWLIRSKSEILTSSGLWIKIFLLRISEGRTAEVEENVLNIMDDF